MCWPPATTVFLRGLEADLWFPPSGHATVGWDGCARGGERQQVGQQQQGRDPQRLASLSVMLHVCDRSATAPVGQAVARPKDLLVPFLLIQRLPSLQSDEFLERAILSYESTNSPPWAIQRSLPLRRRHHCCCCCRHSLLLLLGQTMLVVMLYQCFCAVVVVVVLVVDNVVIAVGVVCQQRQPAPSETRTNKISSRWMACQK